MVYEGGYAVLLVLHLLVVVFVIGPLALAAVQSPRLVQAGDVAGLRAAARASRLYAGLSVLAVALGAAMVADRWEASSTWVVASYALWFVAVTLHVVVVGKAQQEAIEALEAGAGAGGAAGRMRVGGGLAMLCWAAIVVLMVVKPGA